MLGVPPDADYLGYLHWHTMALLFGMLATLTAIARARVFHALGGKVVGAFRTLRGLVLGLVLLTAAASALFTNDIALLALLPLAWISLERSGHRGWTAYTFVLMTASANLGGMATPFGSPQNLFLFSFFEMPAMEFLRIMAVPTLAALLILGALCCFVPARHLTVQDLGAAHLSPRTPIYLGLFVLMLLIVFRLIPAWGVLAVPLTLWFADRRSLARMDWGLLVTFAAFFVFSGNLSRIPEVTDVLGSWMHTEPLLTSILASQIISNVPAALLLAPFADAVSPLLIGVNIGGVGTLVASLASLIALAEYRRVQPGQTGRFLLVFSAVNVGLLLALTTFVLWTHGT